MSKPRWLPAMVLVTGLVLTVAAAWLVNGLLLRAQSSEAAVTADHATAAVRLALDRAAIAVRAVRAMYAADTVGTDEFERFAQTLATSQSVAALCFVRRVAEADRQTYEQSLTTGPAATLGIWENDPAGKPVRAAERPVYFVVQSALLPGNAVPPVGFDAGSLSDRAAAIQRALASSNLTITGEVQLAQLHDAGIVLFDPVVDREGEPIGVATGSVTRDELVTTAASTSGIADIKLAIGDAGSAAGAATDTSSVDGVAGGSTTHVFPFADRLVTVRVAAAVSPGARPWIDMLIIALGLAATAAVVAALFNRAKTAELHVAEARVRAILDGLGPIALLLTPEGIVINANRAATAMFRRSADDMLQRPFAELLAPDDAQERQTLDSAIVAASHGDDVRFDLKRESADGRQVFDLWIRRKQLTGNLVASAVDVTDRYEAEETQRLLMRELDHRMKNTLQVIQAVIRRTATTQDSIPKFEQALLGRVGAMSRAHDLLASERWHGADISAVVRQETEHLSVGRAISAEGPHIRLTPKAALSIALVIHELGTNAIKYGALSANDGSVEISWRVDRRAGEPSLILRWRESHGPRVVRPGRRGFGSLLIERSIAYELDGSAELDYREQGLVCTIAAPLKTVRSSLSQARESMLVGQ